MPPILIIAAIVAGILMAIFDVKEETTNLILAIVIVAVLLTMR